MRKMMKAIAAVLAVTTLMAGTAFAAGTDKLSVKGTDGTTTKFSVQDDGSITTSGGIYYDGTSKLTGFGTTSPIAALSVTAITAPATRGLVISQHTSNAASAVAGFRKSRGSEAVPATVNSGDYIGAFNFFVNDGTSYIATGSFGARITGTVSTGIVPTEIYFCNSSTNVSNCYTEGKVKMLISAAGYVGINSTAPTSQLQVVGLPTYASNALAISGGLTVGAFYTDGAGNVKVVY